MSAFSQYASFYDQLYQDKDYHAETTFVEQLIQRYSPGARSILASVAEPHGMPSNLRSAGTA